jgi:hypothetical protein
VKTLSNNNVNPIIAKDGKNMTIPGFRPKEIPKKKVVIAIT